MEIVGKSLRTRVLRALAVFVALLVYGYLVPPINWATTLLVPPLFFVFSITSDWAVRQWLDEE